MTAPLEKKSAGLVTTTIINRRKNMARIKIEDLEPLAELTDDLVHEYLTV